MNCLENVCLSLSSFLCILKQVLYCCNSSFATKRNTLWRLWRQSRTNLAFTIVKVVVVWRVWPDLRPRSNYLPIIFDKLKTFPIFLKPSEALRTFQNISITFHTFHNLSIPFRFFKLFTNFLNISLPFLFFRNLFNGTY